MGFFVLASVEENKKGCQSQLQPQKSDF